MAIVRYRQNDPDLYGRLWHQAGNEYAINPAAMTTAGSIDAALLTKLHADTNDRLDRAAPRQADALEDATVFENDVITTRLFVDVERFYVGTDAEFNARRKSAVDREWVPRPRLPVKATVYLQDSRGMRVDNLVERSALGDFRVKWTWTDTALITRRVPTHSALRPSRTRQYVERAVREIAVAIPSARHNARAAVGGLIRWTPVGGVAIHNAAAIAAGGPPSMSRASEKTGPASRSPTRRSSRARTPGTSPHGRSTSSSSRPRAAPPTSRATSSSTFTTGSSRPTSPFTR